MQSRYDARNPAALKQLVGSGVKLFRFPKDVLDAAFKEAMALYSELNGKNPAWKKICDDYAAFGAARTCGSGSRRPLRRLHAAAEALNVSCPTQGPREGPVIGAYSALACW